MRYRIAIAAGALTALATLPAPAAAQTASGPHERLAFFEGTWTDSLRPGYRETCSWLAPRRRVLACRAGWMAGEDSVEAMAIYSYDRRDSTYVYYGAFPNGTFHLVGRPDRDGWRFEPVGQIDERPLQLRYHLTPVAGGVRYVEEASENGAPWRVTEDYVLLRVPDE